jgi:hypothetical protein
MENHSLAKVLFVTDLHKRDIDFTSIGGYTKAIDEVQSDLLKFIEQQGVTHMISTGDWYDKGYKSTNRVNSDRNFDEKFSKLTDFSMCLGNHFFLERDNNPEMYLIQPHPKHKPLKPIAAFEPVIKTPDKIRIDPVQISLFHYGRDDKDYTARRDEDVTCHIGVYHDDCVVPSSVRQKARYYGTTSSGYLQRIYANIDMAVIGHIHTPIGLERIDVGGRTIPLFIPGSLCVTKNKGEELHTSVKLPMVEITDTVSCRLHTFSLHLDMVKFYNKREAQKAGAEESFELEPLEASVQPPNVSLTDYLVKKGYGSMEIDFVKKLGEGNLDALQIKDLLTG